MKRDRQLDGKEMAAWVESKGGVELAAQAIQEKLECSESKALKLARGSYDRLPTASEQIALAELMKRPRDVVYPLVGAKGSRRKAS